MPRINRLHAVARHLCPAMNPGIANPAASAVDVEPAFVPPDGLDSISLMPTLEGRGREQLRHGLLYWEFYEQGGRQAVRRGRFKAIRQPMHVGVTQLFDLEADLGESRDLAAERPGLVAELELAMDRAHEPHPLWSPAGEAGEPAPPGDGVARF